MSLRALLIVVVLGQAAAASDFDVDWSTLTDFTVDVEIDGRHARKAPPQSRDYRSHGTIHADVLGQRIMITSSVQSTVDTPFLSAAWQGEALHYDYKFVFDGTRGFATLVGKVHLDATDSVICTRVNLPQGFLPPPELMNAQLTGAEPQIERGLNQAPHTDMTVDGEKVFVYEGPRVWAGIQHNGLLVGLADHPPMYHGLGVTWEPFVKFANWAKGAGEIADPHCPATSVAELLANPETAKALDGIDQVMTALKSTTYLQQAFAHLPQQPSLIFMSAATMELNAAKPDANIAVQSVALSSMVAVAGVVGALSAAATMAIVLMMSKSFARSSGRIALISDDA